jgi:uncharacterized protein
MGTIADALFASTRQAVLRLFFSNPEKRFYVRDAIRRLKIGTGNVQKELARLSQAGILTRTREGHQIYYQANHECPVFPELRLLCRKTFGVAGVLREALESVAPKIRFGFVYGSVAAGTETAESDIDLILVGDSLKLSDVVSRLAKVSQEISREVNASTYRTGEFFQRLADRKHFLTRVLDGPKLFIIGTEDELRRMAEERVAYTASKQSRGNSKSIRDR